MAEQSHIELVRRAFEAFEKGDLDTVKESFSPDVTWFSAGRNWLVGTYQGIDAVIGLLATIFAYSEGTYRAEITDILAGDDVVVVLQKVEASRSDGRSMSVGAVLVAEIADGRIGNVRAWPDDLYSEDEFYGAEPPAGWTAPARG
ncbi:nuclear transport factor 2 family protein [Nocardia sp. BMG111209]|uniref:nuclear transport factor 2 family protein n=1 Tax=Nocardia sp. BMG111209 TaxID=1160137 RepID=UPI00036A7143|nr:nuclear transport factor 2 family protein [Nocardia sp. BMG111209]